MKKSAVIGGFILSLFGSFMLALLGLVALLFNGFMGGPKDVGAGTQALVFWGIAFVGLWGGTRIFKRPGTTLTVMLWLLFILFVIELAFNRLDVIVGPLTLGPYALTALLAYYLTRQMAGNTAPKA